VQSEARVADQLRDGMITDIDILADHERLARVDLVSLTRERSAKPDGVDIRTRPRGLTRWWLVVIGCRPPGVRGRRTATTLGA
jgi:hypothetical protein